MRSARAPPTSRLSSADDRRFRARLAEVLAERDEGIMAAYVEDESDVPYHRLRDALAAQTKQRARAPRLLRLRDHRCGRGVADDRHRRAAAGIRGRSRRPGRRHGLQDRTRRRAARRSPTSGCSRGRSRRATGCTSAAVSRTRSTAITVFERGPAVQRPSVSAGAVAKLWGLAEIQIGDRIGETGTDAAEPSVRAADAGVGRRRRHDPTTAHGSASPSPSSPSRTR